MHSRILLKLRESWVRSGESDKSNVSKYLKSLHFDDKWINVGKLRLVPVQNG